MGMEFAAWYAPRFRVQNFFPQRFAYFRDGALYTLQAKLMDKDDPTLVAFVEKELQQQAAALQSRPYVPFVDHGPPLKSDGSIDVDLVRTFGLKIPEGHYLALGDNFAMSADSRDFGFVPQSNIRGGPSFLLWPTGERWGLSDHAPKGRWITLPTMLVWSVFAAVMLGWSLYRRKYLVWQSQKQIQIRADAD